MTVLGRYEIIEQLGAGAMGNVYRARDTTLEREVALKTIRTGTDVDPEVRQRFYTEARACARLQHSSIITVYDLGEVNNTAFIAMELLHGSDFRRIIQERKAFPTEQKIGAVAQICEALAHAHRHGVVHRDIKPSNLFITEEGRAKVLDFGIARLPSSRLTVAGQILGTPNYMAPEQILARPTDGRSDLFSVAVIFFELLTYSHPFQGALIPRRIVQGDPDSLFDYDSTLPLVLERVISRGLAKDPDRRYQTGDEFAADLNAVLDALRQNASPSFSRLELPSQRALPVQVLPLQIFAPTEVPAGVDPHEWRLSEALRLMPEFEDAINDRDGGRARTIVADLESRLAGDIRFAEAMRLCRSRLAEIESPDPTSPVARAIEVPRAAGAQAPVTQVATGAAYNSVNLDDATFFRTAPMQKCQPSSPVVEVEKGQVLEPPPQPTIPPATSVPSEAKKSVPGFDHPRVLNRLDPKTTRRVLIVAGGALCLIVFMVALIIALRPVPIEAAAAMAVARRNAVLFEMPSGDGRKMATILAGSRVNVLQLPGSASQQWVHVQRVTQRVLRPGYLRLNDLSDWNAKTAPSALALAHIFGPSESARASQIQDQINTLNKIPVRFSGDPAAEDARLEALQWKLVLIRREQEGGAQRADLLQELSLLRSGTERFANNSKLQGAVLALVNQIAALAATIQVSAPEQQRAVPPGPDLAGWMHTARIAWDDGDYTTARQYVIRVLQNQPDHTEAQVLKNKIETALARERSYETTK